MPKIIGIKAPVRESFISACPNCKRPYTVNTIQNPIIEIECTCGNNFRIEADPLLFYMPKGKRDKGGRWYPDESEIASCCNAIRRPSAHWPNSLWTHCNTKKHKMTLAKEKGEKSIVGK